MSTCFMLENYPDLLDTGTLAQLLGQSVPTVRKLLHKGELPSVRIGRRFYVPRSALIEYINARIAGQE